MKWKPELDMSMVYTWALGWGIVLMLYFGYGLYLSHYHGGILHTQSREKDERTYVHEEYKSNGGDKLNTDPYGHW